MSLNLIPKLHHLVIFFDAKISRILSICFIPKLTVPAPMDTDWNVRHLMGKDFPHLGLALAPALAASTVAARLRSNHHHCLTTVGHCSPLGQPLPGLPNGHQ